MFGSAYTVFGARALLGGGAGGKSVYRIKRKGDDKRGKIFFWSFLKQRLTEFTLLPTKHIKISITFSI